MIATFSSEVDTVHALVIPFTFGQNMELRLKMASCKKEQRERMIILAFYSVQSRVFITSKWKCYNSYIYIVIRSYAFLPDKIIS